MKLFTQRQPNKLREQYGAFKVWECNRRQLCRPTGIKPEWIEYQVRQGNNVLARYDHLFPAMQDAKARNQAEWDAIGEMLK
jgi:hypothetical protein